VLLSQHLHNSTVVVLTFLVEVPRALLRITTRGHPSSCSPLLREVSLFMGGPRPLASSFLSCRSSWNAGSFPFSLRPFLREHHWLAEDADGGVFLALSQHCLYYSFGGYTLADDELKDASRFRPRRTKLQRVLHRVFLFLAVVTDRGHLPLYT
jgi:hypothetical protein